jgi:hypothetical protein
MRLFLIVFCSLIYSNSFSQTQLDTVFFKIPYSFGGVTKEEMLLKAPQKYKDVDAMIIHDYGDLAFTDIGSVLERGIKIKIFRKSGFNKWANFKVSYIDGYKKWQLNDSLKIVKASVYNLENGEIIETTLDFKNIKYSKIYGKFHEAFVPIPNVKEGSVIEFTYRHISPQLHNFKAWYTHKEIPVLWSDFSFSRSVQQTNSLTEVREVDPFFKVENTTLHPKFSYGLNLSKIQRWVMKDIPPLQNEPFVDNILDFSNKISNEITTIVQYGSITTKSFYGNYEIPDNKVFHFSDTWLNLRKTLMKHEDFGDHIKRIGGININEIVKNNATKKEKIEAIFNYVRKNISWNGQEGFMVENPLREVLAIGEGSSAEINLTLLSILKMANINAQPVLTSTRQNGKLGEHPIIKNFNYVLVHTIIDKDTVLLDATDRNLPMGLLPKRCLNEKGFLLSESPEWIIIKPKAKQIEDLDFDGEIDKEGNLKGILKISGSGYFEGIFNQISSENNENIKKNLFLEYPQAEVFNIEKNPTEIKIQFKIEDYAKIVNDIIYFNPFCIGKIENPFTINERHYPIDFVIPFEKNTKIRIKIPKGFIIENLPKNDLFSITDKSGTFNYSINKSADSVFVDVNFVINNPLFHVKDYSVLKHLYDFTVDKQLEDIVLEVSKK